MEVYKFEELGLKNNGFVGIYCIRYTAGTKKYVGQTKHKKGFSGRFQDHRELLRAGIHDNIFLQRSYDKHGEASFYFQVLEICKRTDNLFEREKYWMEKLEAMYNQDGWNMQSIDDQLKRKNFSPSKEIVLFSPSGERLIFNSQKEFCAEYNMDSGCICRLINKKIKSYKGWSICPEKNNKCRYKFVNDFGHIEEVFCVGDFLEKGVLTRNQFYFMIKNMEVSVSGWRCVENNLKEKEVERKVVSPDGQLIIFNDKFQFKSKFPEVNFQKISALYKGVNRQSNGWKNPNECIVLRSLGPNTLHIFTSHKEVASFMKIHRKTLMKFLEEKISSTKFKLEEINSLPITNLTKKL